MTLFSNFVGIVYSDSQVFTAMIKFAFDWFDLDQNGIIDGCDVLQFVR